MKVGSHYYITKDNYILFSKLHPNNENILRTIGLTKGNLKFTTFKVVHIDNLGNIDQIERKDGYLISTNTSWISKKEYTYFDEIMTSDTKVIQYNINDKEHIKELIKKLMREYNDR